MILQLVTVRRIMSDVYVASEGVIKMSVYFSSLIKVIVKTWIIKSQNSEFTSSATSFLLHLEFFLRSLIFYFGTKIRLDM